MRSNQEMWTCKTIVQHNIRDSSFEMRQDSSFEERDSSFEMR